MSAGFQRTYNIHRDYASVLKEARKWLKTSDGWYFAKRSHPSVDSDMITFNDPTKKNPLPWEVSNAAFSYAMIFMEPGKSQVVRIGASTELVAEKGPWTTLTVSDDGHPLTLLERSLPWAYPQPKPTGGTETVIRMPAPGKAGQKAILP